MAVLPFSMEVELGSLGTDLPSEPILLGLAIIGFWAILTKSRTLRSYYSHPLFIILLLHLVWSFCCILSSGNTIFSLKYALSKSWYIFGSVAASIWLIQSKEVLQRLLLILACSMLVTVIIINVEHGMTGFLFDTINAAANPLYRNHVIYAVFIVMVLPFLFVLRGDTRKQSMARLLMDSAIALILFASYFAYTRGAWLAVLLLPVVWYLIYKKILKIAYPLALVGAVVFFMYLSKDYHYLRYAPNFETTVYHDDLEDHLTATFEGEDMSTMERFHRWIAAFRLFKQYPIMGIGPNTFVDRYKPYTSPSFETYISENEERSTVHNYFIYILAEQGIVGFLIVVILVGYFFIHGEKRYATFYDPDLKRWYLACLLCGFVFWLNNLFSDLLEANKVAPLWLMSVAWMILLEKWDEKKKSQAHTVSTD